jgi:hypothetical protein
VDDEPAVAVEDGAEEEEGPADVDVGDVDVPVLMRPRWLLETLALLVLKLRFLATCVGSRGVPSFLRIWAKWW